ncbi:Peptide deformylase 1A, chloroplastic/mitochondrial [Thoreauomyces humboldtii]|nr:Peptide deformylase 1A, chloroplastic/mitochondrial [Thoreauomyces humboldtii]
MNRLAGWLRRPPAVLRAGHPSLRMKSVANFQAEPVKVAELNSHKLERVVREMRTVFDSPYTPVVGLAAPQIGHPLRLIAYRLEDAKLLKESNMARVPLTFMVNPELSVTDRRPESEWVSDYESCESVPHYNAKVKRANEVKVQGLDLDGNPVTVNAKGFLAKVLQHECDHLEGQLYIDKMDPKSFRHDKYIDKYEVYTPRK